MSPVQKLPCATTNCTNHTTVEAGFAPAESWNCPQPEDELYLSIRLMFMDLTQGHCEPEGQTPVEGIWEWRIGWARWARRRSI
jgi:hypothetical protein